MLRQKRLTFLNKEGITCGYCGKQLKQGDRVCGDPEGENGLKPLPKVKGE
jgi:hypothetical protein